MTAGAVAETWDQWASRVTGELAGLADGAWLTITPATAPSPAPSTETTPPYAASPPPRRRRWPLGRGSSTQRTARGPLPDVFLQARRLGDVLALECISDTEFVGLSDLSPVQERGLVQLGWEQDGHEAAFHRTFVLDADDADEAPAPGTPAEAAARVPATEVAAHLLRDSLEQVLGAAAPDEVVLRRSAEDT